MAKSINDAKTSKKGCQERVSGWLERYDFVSGIAQCVLSENAKYVTDNKLISVDLSDISKAWGGEGMEGMEDGLDGSTKRILKGHTLRSAVIPGATNSDAVRPLVLQLLKGRHDPIKRIMHLCDQVMTATCGKGILLIDRGGDCAELINHFYTKKYNFIIRIKDTTRNVFLDAKINPEGLNDRPGTWADKGEILPFGAPVWVVRHNFVPDKKSKKRKKTIKKTAKKKTKPKNSIFYYTNINTPITLLTFVPNHYRRRWSIEVFFRDIKQLFSLEKVCVRTFKRLSNLVALTLIAYYFIIIELPDTQLHTKLLNTVQKHFNTTIIFPKQFRLFLTTLRNFFAYKPHAGGRPKIPKIDFQSYFIFPS